MKRARHFFLRALSVGIIGLVLVQTGAAGQSIAGLIIQVLEANEGENLTDRELPPLKVRVMDRTGRIIPGASVQFLAPDDGPTGHFLPNSSQVTVTSDNQGIASAPRFRTNSKVGDYQIEVVASYRDSVSRASIPQTNIFKRKSSSSNKKFIIISAVIGGAAAAFANMRNGSGPASPALEALASPTISLGGSPVGVSPSITPTSTGSSGGGTISTAPSSGPTGGSVQQPAASQPSGGTTTSTPSACIGIPPTSNRRSCR